MIQTRSSFWAARLIGFTLCGLSATGCGLVGELAYESAVQRELRNCERLPDMAAYRACRERIQAGRGPTDKKSN